ncbi:MAG: hypothetical protein ACXU85_20095, partial [Xanthobacteraceae bacterium]
EHCRNFSILHRHGSQPHKVALRTADDLQSLLASSPSRKPEQLVHPPFVHDIENNKYYLRC